MRDAVASGADALAMAGGDGSHAVVASIAAELTALRLHPGGHAQPLALDLGVDRDDVVGALDAFGDGGERRVDLAEVNGRVFVNNVSLGLYADAVQRSGYRDAKLRTIRESAAAPHGQRRARPRPNGYERIRCRPSPGRASCASVRVRRRCQNIASAAGRSR